MDQILFGSAFPFVIAVMWYAARGCRASPRFLVVTPVAMVLSAVWAVVPDIPRLLGFHDLYMRMAADPRCDIFLWHYTIDQIEPESSWFAAGGVVMAAGLLVVGLRELFKTEAAHPPH